MRLVVRMPLVRSKEPAKELEPELEEKKSPEVLKPAAVTVLELVKDLVRSREPAKELEAAVF